MIPDWQWHNFEPEEVRMLDSLDGLRADHPILWAMVTGLESSAGIAKFLGMPYEAVLYELREYKRKGEAIDIQRPTGIVWKIESSHYRHLAEFVKSIRSHNRRQLRARREDD